MIPHVLIHASSERRTAYPIPIGRPGRSRPCLYASVGSVAASFSVSGQFNQGSHHSVNLTATAITVAPHGVAFVDVTLNVPTATARTSDAFTDVAGQIVFTPVSGANGDISLRVPYYFVPRALSNVRTRLTKVPKKPSWITDVANYAGAVSGSADFYAWGLSDPAEPGGGSEDLRAAGVQSFPNDELMVFAINTYKRWSNASVNEFDVLIDVNGDSVPDYDVIGVDYGALTTGSFDGRMATVVFSLSTGDAYLLPLAIAPPDTNTVLLPVFFSYLCLPSSPCLTPGTALSYTVNSYGLFAGSSDQMAGLAKFNPYAPAINTGMFANLSPNQTTNFTVNAVPSAWAQTPALGLMIVSLDNRRGASL